MKIKRMVKRLFAVGTGVAMLGATAMGAMAADLNEYPNMFVDNGRFNGFLVVGENAQAVDNLAMTDIAANMKVAKAGSSTGTTTTTLSGDTWLVGTSSKKLEMANSNASSSSVGAETFRDITTFIDEEDLGALSDGTWSTNENDYGFQQFIFFDDDADQSVNRIVKYAESDDDVTGNYLFFKSSRQIGRYKLEFTSNAQSDVTDSSGTASTTGTYLDDFEDTDLSLMGKDFAVVLARRTSSGGDANQNGIKLTLMAGSSRDTLLEGETKSYTVGGKTYEVELSFVDSDEAKFVVNGEATNKLKVGETYTLSDKSEIGISEVLYQSYAGGVHSSTFFVGAQKLVLQDDDVSAAGTGEQKLKIGSEDIDGTLVTITGSDNNVTFTVNTIEVNMTADDDYFVGAGEKLSEVIAAAGEEKEVLMGNAFDVEYTGLAGETTRDLKLSSSSATRYKLHLFDGDGNAVDIPIAYAVSATNITVGEDNGLSPRSSGNQKRTILDETQYIYKNDYFVVTGGTNTDGSAKSYLLQYRGSDKSTDTSPKINFKNLGSGESLEYSATNVAGGATVATIKLGGYSFVVETPGSDQTTKDYPIRVQLDTSAIANTTNGTYIDFVDAYGSNWAFNWSNGSNRVFAGPRNWTSQNHTKGVPNSGSTFYNDVKSVQLLQSTPNGDDYDNVVPANLGINISATSGPELRAALFSSIAPNITIKGNQNGPVILTTPDGETEVSYGYTSMGAKITFNEPSGSPDELVFEYPDVQRLPRVYFTSGSTTRATATGGNLVAVEVVDATKLDSEISSVSAQNLIVVGGPCVNTVAAELMGNPAGDCTAGFVPGKARVKLFEHANGNMAMLVAGYNGADTRLAGKVVANRPGELSGMEVQIEGTTASSATISRPSS